MKSYLLFSLFFLSILSTPIFNFAQEINLNPTEKSENTTNHPSIKYESNHSDQNVDTSLINQDVDYHNQPNTWPEHVSHESDTFQAKFFNMLFILGLLIGFMILASWSLKRMMKSKMTQLNTANSIKIIETRYLSPRATVYLIEVQDKNFLIAESPTAVTHLASFPLQNEQTHPLPSSRPPFFSDSK